jgi:hypothetical protein
MGGVRREGQRLGEKDKGMLFLLFPLLDALVSLSLRLDGRIIKVPDSQPRDFLARLLELRHL